jgi:hypothetical protein
MVRAIGRLKNILPTEDVAVAGSLIAEELTEAKLQAYLVSIGL